MNKLVTGSIFLILLIAYSNAASPLFISAITSALATIPFSGGPMSTGLVGAKLGIGTKLLYYLGYFGRKSSTPKKKTPSPKLPTIAESGFSSQHFQSMTSGGFPNSFPVSNFQNSFGGVDPSQLFQALTAQGVDPNVVMEALNFAGGMNVAPNAFATNAAFGGFGTSGSFGAGGGRPDFPANSGFSSGMPGRPSFSANSGFSSAIPARPDFPSNLGFSPAVPVQQFTRPQGGGAGGSFNQLATPEISATDNESEDEAESFFTFMQDMDENTCISRLICDIGHTPSFLGEFSENISSMVSSLKVPPTSRAYKYIEIMENGKKEGQCGTKFPECGDTSYEVVKNVAPSVSLPQNVNSADINF